MSQIQAVTRAGLFLLETLSIIFSIGRSPNRGASLYPSKDRTRQHMESSMNPGQHHRFIVIFLTLVSIIFFMYE